MGNLSIGLKQIYGGIKTIFRRGSKVAAEETAKTTAKTTAYKGPSFIDMARRQPLGLPAPTAEQLAADKPQIMVSKVLGTKDIYDLKMTQEILADGTHVRYFTDPVTKQRVITMKDSGILHQEWIKTPNKGDIYLKTTRNGDRYVLNRNGDFVQIEKRSLNSTEVPSTNDLYYSDYNGNKVHLHNEKTTKGITETTGNIYGTIKERLNDNVYTLNYGATTKGNYLKINDAPPGHIELSGMYERHNDVFEAASSKVHELFDMAKEKFIPDIDAAFFNQYRDL